MKKYAVACAAIMAALTITSCGSSKESAYRKAYEKAKAQEQNQNPTQGQNDYTANQQPVYDNQTVYVQQPTQYDATSQSTYNDQAYNSPVTEQTPVVTPLAAAPAQTATTQVAQPTQTTQLAQPAQTKAVAQPVQTTTQVAQPVKQQPVKTTTQAANKTTIAAAKDNVPVRTESVSLVKGAGLKAYSVVVGSFGVLANAEGLQSTLTKAGYQAQVVKNNDRNMYRVIVTTFDSKDSAIESRNNIRATYPDAWLLMQK